MFCYDDKDQGPVEPYVKCNSRPAGKEIATAHDLSLQTDRCGRRDKVRKIASGKKQV